MALQQPATITGAVDQQRGRVQLSRATQLPDVLPLLARGATGFVLVALAWQALAVVRPSPFVPPVPAIAGAFAQLLVSGELARHAFASVRTVLLGFCLASGLGLLLGVLFVQWRALSTVFVPVLDAVRPISALALFPLLIVVFGLGQTSKALVIFWTAWPAVMLGTIYGLQAVDRQTIEAATLDGAGRWRLLAHVRAPLAAPAIATALSIAMSGAWISLVAAEMLGGNAGLGYAVLTYSQTFRFPQMYAAIVCIALCGLALNRSLAALQTFIQRRIA